MTPGMTGRGRTSTTSSEQASRSRVSETQRAYCMTAIFARTRLHKNGYSYSRVRNKEAMLLERR